jgi:twinkle protein
MLDAAELKDQLGQRAKQIILSGLSLREVKGKIRCPLHNDKEPSMSWFKDGMMFRCHACGEQLDIYRYYTEFEHLSFPEAVAKVADQLGVIDTQHFETKIEKKEFVKPKIGMNELSQAAIDYMGKRKITKETLEAWKVKERKWGGMNVYVFQYFNSNNELEYVSYRKVGKCGKGEKGGCETNTKGILWGMDHIDKTKPLVICEGQPDAMVIYQCGYKNVVSVPGGSTNFKWIDHCWEWLQDIKEFIVWCDQDKIGKEMGAEIKRRLSNVKIMWHPKYKDANEVLFYQGEKEVLDFVEKAIKQTPEGIIDVAEMEYTSLLETQENGIETGFIEYDEHVEDLKEEELTVVFGRNGEGKTTFVSQIIGHCLYKKVPVFLYSGEMSDRKLQDWTYRQVAGTNEKYYRNIQCKYRTKKELLPEVVASIKKWHRDLFYLFDRSAEKVCKDTDKFFDVMEIAAKRYGVKLFVIDNLMSKLEENADSINSDQANFVQGCKNFAIRNKVHIILLAHPNKLKKELSEDDIEGNLEKTDISGSNNIPNKADNIISVERNFENAEVDAIIKSLKDRESGQRKVMRFLFSKSTLRFYNDRTKEQVNFGWEKDYLQKQDIKKANARAEKQEFVSNVDILNTDVPF